MALHPLLLSAVVGIAALGAFPSPAVAEGRGYISISVGTPAPYYRGDYYRGGYGGGHRLWVQGHWASTYRGRVWVPGQYVQARGYGYDRGYYDRGYYDRGYGYNDGYGYNGGYGYGARVIYRSSPYHQGDNYYQRGGYRYPRGYYQRGGYGYPRGYYPPRDHRPYRGW